MSDKPQTRPNRLAWAGVITAAVTVVFSLFNWTSAEIPRTAQNPAYDVGNSAWSSGFSAWAAVLLMVLAGVISFLLLPRARAVLATTWLILSGLAVLLILFRWLTADSVISDALNVSGDRFDQLESLAGASSGAGFGLFVGLIAAVVSVAAAWLSLRASRASRV